ncbi:hypothetical protein BJV78DRAFT_1286683 [Lactifluus subvellereus]|nr:hypothetical protein BJV78DRAFT_1286683 [Lactifluus subvellereus]
MFVVPPPYFPPLSSSQQWFSRSSTLTPPAAILRISPLKTYSLPPKTKNVTPAPALLCPQHSGGIKHLSDPKRHRRVSARSTPQPLSPRKNFRPTRPRHKDAHTTTKINVTPPSESHSPVPVSVTFPRRLPELSRKQISSEVLASLGFTPEVPAQYIRDRMERLAPSMYQVLRLTKATASGSSLPKTLPITVHGPTLSTLPTHMAAVYSSAPSAPEPRRVTMYPIHQSILSLYLPLALPNPESFPILTQFLYLKDVQPLLQTFLCLAPAKGLPGDLDQPERYDAFVAECSAVLAQNYTMQRLASQAVKVHGFWRNAHALGISDVDLQAFFDFAWEVLMKAMVHSSSSAPVTVST